MRQTTSIVHVKLTDVPYFARNVSLLPHWPLLCQFFFLHVFIGVIIVVAIECMLSYSSWFSNMMPLPDSFPTTMMHFEDNYMNICQKFGVAMTIEEKNSLPHDIHFLKPVNPSQGIISLFYSAIKLSLYKMQHCIYCMWFVSFYLPQYNYPDNKEMLRSSIKTADMNYPWKCCQSPICMFSWDKQRRHSEGEVWNSSLIKWE